MLPQTTILTACMVTDRFPQGPFHLYVFIMIFGHYDYSLLVSTPHNKIGYNGIESS